jgi:hypothetical protein
MTSRWACALLLALAACGEEAVGTTPAGPNTAVADDGPPRTQADEDTLDALDKILECLQEVRGRTFEQPVVVGFYDRDQLGDWLLEHFYDDMTPEEFARATRAYKALGFIPPDMDLEQLMLDALTVAIGGFYDVYEKRLYAMTSGLGLMNKYVMIHETAHALQDQHVDLERFAFPKEDQRNDDQFMGIAAVVEGGATAVTDMVMSRCDDLIGAEDIDAAGLAEALLQQVAVSSGIPPIIQDGMTFPYLEGAAFVNAVLEQGGWDAVNELYANPPRSSEQVIHPEKFLDPAQRDEPVPVKAPDMASFLGPGWRTAYRNVLGELGVRQLVRFTGDPGQTFRASWGWGGDEYRLYENQYGDEFLQWVSVWDSADDAVDMIVSLENVLRRQAADGPPVEVVLDADATELRLTDAEGTLRELARREGTIVVWFRGLAPGFPAQSMADRCLP